MDNIIEVRDLCKRFGDNIALDRISFSLKKGEILAFLGPSGSGKTTTINILTGQLNSDSGISEIFGIDSRSLKPKDLERIGILSDLSGFYKNLTLEDNILVYSKLLSVSKERVNELLKSTGLYEHRKTKADKLSKGTKQRMMLVRALLNNPPVLFLDEPTSGLDPQSSLSIHKILKQLKREGTTIFLTTHDMSEAQKLSDNVVLLNKGSIVEYGSPHELLVKYAKDKEIVVTFNNGEKKSIKVNSDFDLNNYFKSDEIFSFHSQELDLNDIFLQITGEVLDEENK